MVEDTERLPKGVPQQPQETSFYVFNRVENGGFRWISYQEAREQEFVAPDDELLEIISLGRSASSPGSKN